MSFGLIYDVGRLVLTLINHLHETRENVKLLPHHQILPS